MLGSIKQLHGISGPSVQQQIKHQCKQLVNKEKHGNSPTFASHQLLEQQETVRSLYLKDKERDNNSLQPRQQLSVVTDASHTNRNNSYFNKWKWLFQHITSIAAGMFSTRLHSAFPASMGGNARVTNITPSETKGQYFNI